MTDQERAVEFAQEFVWLYERAAPLDSDIVESFRDIDHNARVYLASSEPAVSAATELSAAVHSGDVAMRTLGAEHHMAAMRAEALRALDRECAHEGVADGGQTIIEWTCRAIYLVPVEGVYREQPVEGATQ